MNALILNAAQAANEGALGPWFLIPTIDPTVVAIAIALAAAPIDAEPEPEPIDPTDEWRYL